MTSYLETIRHDEDVQSSLWNFESAVAKQRSYEGSSNIVKPEVVKAHMKRALTNFIDSIKTLPNDHH
jgi:hypothetical protein